MTEHSRKPWRVGSDRPEGVVITDRARIIVAIAFAGRGVIDEETRATARRIVAAWNACRGLETAELEGSDLAARLHELGRSMARDAPALGLLRRLVEAGDESGRVHDGDPICHYCRAPARYIKANWHAAFDHAPDCPYMAARAFLEGREP